MPGDHEDDGGDDQTDVDAGVGIQDVSAYVNIDPDDPESEVPAAYAWALRQAGTAARDDEGKGSEELADGLNLLPARGGPSEVGPLAILVQSLSKITELRGAPQDAMAAPPPRGRLDARRLEILSRLRSEGEDRSDGHAKTLNRPILDVPLSAIGGRRVENVRLQEDEVALRALCENLRVEGQLHPITVVASSLRPGRYEPVAGFRRLRAAAELGWPTIKALVYPAGTSDQELFFVNAVENAHRFRLSEYEIASRAQLMSARFGTTLADYARRLGLSEGRVQNLVRYLETLAPDILEAWRSGDRLLNDHMLQKLASMPHDEASEYWAAWKARHTQADTASNRDRSRPRTSENRPTGMTLGRLWVAVKRSQGFDEGTRDLVLKVVEFCQGHAVAIPGVFDPRRAGSAVPSAMKRRKISGRTGEAGRELPLPPLPPPGGHDR